MKYDSTKHHRRSIRLKGYDYSKEGAYFVTICTNNRECLFGEIVNGEMKLNAIGQIVKECWLEIPNIFPDTQLDEFVIMPNHIHGILFLNVGARFIVPNKSGFDKSGFDKSGFGKSNPYIGNNPMMSPKITLGKVIRTFKAKVSFQVRKVMNSPHFQWQKNYYEHIVRNEDELNRIREYIVNNPLQWQFDRENLKSCPLYDNQWRDLEEKIYGKLK